MFSRWSFFFQFLGDDRQASRAEQVVKHGCSMEHDIDNTCKVESNDEKLGLGKRLEWKMDGKVMFSMQDLGVESKARPRLGLLPPQLYMLPELQELTRNYSLVPVCIQEGDWSEDSIKSWAEKLRKEGVTAVVGFAQKDAWHHCLLNRALGSDSISPLAYLMSMNKFMQRASVDLTPGFWFMSVNPDVEKDNSTLISKVPTEQWPCMLKNTSLSLGAGVFKCEDEQRMAEILDAYRENEALRTSIANTTLAITSRLSEAERALSAEMCGGPPPPFLAEHLIDMNAGWVEYCYEGLVDSSGTLVHYGLTEEVYFEDHTGLAYITPPMNLHPKQIPKTKQFLEKFMGKLIEAGYRRQFCNVEFWVSGGKEEDREPKMVLCEINPRCAHTFHYGYKFSVGSNLYRDNFELVLHDTLPSATPLSEWESGGFRVCCEMLINVKNQVDPTTGHVIVDISGKKANECVDYGLLDSLQSQGRAQLVRRIKAPSYVLTKDDANAGPGTTLAQVWFSGPTHEAVAKMEVKLRQQLYKISQPGAVYPKFWSELAAIS
ncbi:unnamed protein product [Symbiodinium sp. CCMP2456]|nr:unnamed protein product [Symbiodinium sp. CCMP2456]